jgi:hypothetical protein
MNKNRNPLILDMYGKVSVQDAKEAISRVLEHVGWVTGSSSWDMDCRSWRHPDPSVGKINVSASLFSLLYTVRQRLALRWRKGVSDAFQVRVQLVHPHMCLCMCASGFLTLGSPTLLSADAGSARTTGEPQ